ncbi:redoxin domain-containing protein [Halalkalicoccus jeotgali]|uniref:Alkyl hydroperoxide reductase/ Thiol specific antioxidant/ Mal allergen n=1 Tax=Halalkalicoccus jeotgali (strain DSM 18796 / CECT 7217 / JCM 14584 / KCTC 4019 / B3) TaxID=795797 RepID=D8J6H1_HALJB|nr:redoxin domain-containing protein [Halalkalicoccus jeotgali]ADJ13848.1 alkyl hydroperoxide reductase/ Thiol specific antioxidant/ Mal allergen [Halalkalicoccus jeotgali B3]ELY34106.1 alkyl hydroperoxide reductase/ Thiol specific antioxidant/ Mal allergen [Halalkalicoccus jeotgali B3]
MIETGESAPDFTVPIARGEAYNDVGEFTLSKHLGDGPVVLAFFPAAFTSGCTEEMCTFRDSLSAFEEVDASVYGISTDLPFAQNEFIRQEGLTFPLLSDYEHEVIRAYDVVREGFYDVMSVAERSVFVIDGDGEIVYRWVETGNERDFPALVEEIRETVEAVAAD